jgi:hypothetical protein
MKMKHIWGGREMDTYLENHKRRPHGRPKNRQDNIKMDGRVWTGSSWVGITTSGRPLLRQCLI